MDQRLYKEARRNNVPASLAYQFATEADRKRAYVFGQYPCDGAVYAVGRVTYTLQVSNDELRIEDMLPDVLRVRTQDEFPEDARILLEPDRAARRAADRICRRLVQEGKEIQRLIEELEVLSQQLVCDALRVKLGSLQTTVEKGVSATRIELSRLNYLEKDGML